MKVLSVELLSEYKGLTPQLFDFSNCEGSVVALIGLNGSGKSQLLEVICETFAWLERKKRADFKVRCNLPFNVTITYSAITSTLSDGRSPLIIGGREKFRVTLSNNVLASKKYLNDEWVSIEIEDLYLPNNIIGYSSGLNENLQRSFLKNDLQFYDVIRIRSNYRRTLAEIKLNADPEMIYKQAKELNFRYLRNYPGIYQESDVNTSEDKLTLVENDTELPSTIFLDYDCNSLLIASLSILESDLFEELFPEVRYKYPKKIELTYDLKKHLIEEDALADIKQLIRIVGTENVNPLSNKISEEDFEIFELEYLKAKISIDVDNPDIKARLAEAYYSDPKTFFKKMYKIQLLGVKEWQADDKKKLRDDSFLGNVKKPLKLRLPLSISTLLLRDENKNTIEFDDLSDGESQLFQNLAALIIFNDDNTLFILDEPETHFNPNWRTYYHQYLINTLKIDNPTAKQLFISTHSPFMISALKSNNVIFFEKREDNAIQSFPVSSQTYGASFDVISKRYFGLRSMIAQTVVEDIKAHLPKEDSVNSRREAKEWVESELGDSMEKAYLLRKLSN